MEQESWFIIIEKPFMMILLALTMFGIGLVNNLRNFKVGLSFKEPIIVTTIIQWIVTPLLAYLVSELGIFDEKIAMGLMIFAIAPSGAFSNLFTLISKGNVALSVTLSLFFNVMVFLTAPFFLYLFFGETRSIDFTEVFTNLLLSLVLPLVVGMLIRARWSEEKSKSWSESTVRVSKILLLLYIVTSVASGRVELFEHGFLAPLLLFIFTLVPYYVCFFYMLSRKYDWPEIVACATEVMVKNTPAAIVIATTVGASGKFLFPIYICSGVTLIMGYTNYLCLKKGLILNRFRHYAG